MFKKIWHYLVNQFENATSKSRKRMNILSNDHYSKLKAVPGDPDIVALATRYGPVHQVFIDKYRQWRIERGIYQSATRQMDDMQKDLSSRLIALWDNQIKVAVGEDTADYLALLPDGREPFQKGGRDARIAAVYELAGALANFPALAALQTEVENFYTQYEQLRDTQQRNEEVIEDYSDQLEEARLACAEMMYGNLGILMDKFRNDPTVIDRFFELELIRQTGADEEEPIPPVETIIITMSTVQNPADKVTLGFKGAAGKLVKTGFGDGNIKSITMDGINYILVGNTYLNNGQYTIASEVEIATLDGIIAAGIFLTAVLHPDGLDAVEYDYSNNLLTSIFFLPTNTKAKRIDVSGNNLDQQSMDTMMMTANGWGTDNGYIKADGGTNATLSGQGIAAKNQLIARGWNVVTN